MSSSSRESVWLNAWYEGRLWLSLAMVFLWPLSKLFEYAAARRRHQQLASVVPLSVPVVIVGNITLGGTGKTPTIIALIEHLRAQGWNPGVVSRGYGGRAPTYPYLVDAQSHPAYSGDEPLLIALETHCPVAVDANRRAAAEYLIEQGCDILLSDDGLQHYALPRNWELCLLDGQRGWGNAHCLPAGPLREPVSRLASVNSVLINGVPAKSLADKLQRHWPQGAPQPHVMTLKPLRWHRVNGSESFPLDSPPWKSDKPLQAMTGIGNPQRFFRTLQQLELVFESQSFPDHHPFTWADFAGMEDSVVIMTAKDAVKCCALLKPSSSNEHLLDTPSKVRDWWYLSVSAELPSAFLNTFDGWLQDQRSD